LQFVGSITAAAAFNFKRMMNKWKKKFFHLFSDAIFPISDAIFSFSFLPSLFKKIKNDFLRVG